MPEARPAPGRLTGVVSGPAEGITPGAFGGRTTGLSMTFSSVGHVCSVGKLGEMAKRRPAENEPANEKERQAWIAAHWTVMIGRTLCHSARVASQVSYIPSPIPPYTSAPISTPPPQFHHSPPPLLQPDQAELEDDNDDAGAKAKTGLQSVSWSKERAKNESGKEPMTPGVDVGGGLSFITTTSEPQQTNVTGTPEVRTTCMVAVNGT
ncbi:unnamed protein product [Protopolystoma xenopodis]|uniref:Uncharacterized protein n=1 Tax=Protopolystoma xenopodis TaxID=117903 RepID=A0A448WB21_9PLAT|nr:unnamed protein product [Protopolystoma xenopodis]